MRINHNTASLNLAHHAANANCAVLCGHSADRIVTAAKRSRQETTVNPCLVSIGYRQSGHVDARTRSRSRQCQATSDRSCRRFRNPERVG